MKNFGTLFGYEMKKIWMRPMTWVTVLLFCMVFVYITVQPFFAAGGTTFTTVDTDGNEISRYLTGGERYRLRVEGARALSGQPMDEAFFQTARDTIPLDKTWFDKESYFYLIDPSYCDFYVEFSEWLNDTAEHYYTHHQNGKELSWQRLSGEDAAYWRAMEARVEKPYVYQPVLGPRMLMNMLGSAGLEPFLPLLVGLCLCDLYAQERRTRADAMIFSSPRGRHCLYLAKTLAGVVSAVGAALLVVASGGLANLLFYGPYGYNGAIQLSPWLWSSSLPITMGQGILILLGLLLAYALVCGAVTALVSVWSGSGVAAMAASVGVMVGAMVLDRTQEGWWEFMPANLVDERGLSSLQVTHLFGARLNILQSGFLLYLLLALMLAGLCWLGWRRNAAGTP